MSTALFFCYPFYFVLDFTGKHRILYKDLH